MQATFRMRHFIGNNGKVFDLVVQRSSVTGQVELDFLSTKGCHWLSLSTKISLRD
jgi:hypothetical protein